MRRILIACALIAAPASAQIAAPPPAFELCRQAANQAFNGRGWQAWLETEMARRGYRRAMRDAELVACRAYIAGANDMAAGRVIPIDTE